MFAFGSPSLSRAAEVELWLRRVPWTNEELVVDPLLFDHRKTGLTLGETSHPLPGKFVELYQMFRDSSLAPSVQRSAHLIHGDVVMVRDDRCGRMAMLCDSRILEPASIGCRALRFGNAVVLLDLGTLKFE